MLAAMTIGAVIFDWGGTLSEFVDAELVDAWRLAAHHLDPAREDEITDRLVQVEADFWATTSSHQRSATLADLMTIVAAGAGPRRGRGVAGGGGRYATSTCGRRTSATTPTPAPTLTALLRPGPALGMLSNTHWPRAFHEHFLERDGLVDLIDRRLELVPEHAGRVYGGSQGRRGKHRAEVDAEVHVARHHRHLGAAGHLGTGLGRHGLRGHEENSSEDDQKRSEHHAQAPVRTGCELPQAIDCSSPEMMRGVRAAAPC